MSDFSKQKNFAEIIAAEVQAKIAALKAGKPIVPSLPPGTTAPSILSVEAKLAEARAKLAMNSNLSGSASTSAKATARQAPLVVYDESGKLNIQSLAGKSLLPKPNFATTKANQRLAVPSTKKKELKLVEPSADFTDVSKNPYYDPSLAGGSAAPKQRTRKNIHFNTPGKFITRANKARAKEMMDKLRKEVAEGAKKAGMEIDSEIPDKVVRKDPPPAVEWWDRALLPNNTYDDFDSGSAKIDTEDSIITIYIQHPVPIRPPVDPGAPTPRPLMLTKKEQKKLRRQARAEVLKDKQDKLRLGLILPDPPKVKLSNLMRVLQNEAIQDPTKIEAKVRKEVEARRLNHEKANADNKLTEEEAREKKRRKLADDIDGVIHVAVFKVHDLSSKKNRYKIDINAQQYNLTGLAIVHGRRNLVIVEGGPKGIRAYKKLMLRRINWDETGVGGEKGDIQANMDEDKSPNRCFLVWEGEVKDRAFKKFGFRSCEGERAVRETLAKFKVEHYWDTAINVSDEELAMREPVL